MAYISGIGAISLPAIPGLPPPPEQLANIVSQVTGGQVQLASGAAPAPAAAPKAAQKTIIPGVPDMAVYIGGAALLAGIAWMVMSKPAMRSNPSDASVARRRGVTRRKARSVGKKHKHGISPFAKSAVGGLILDSSLSLEDAARSLGVSRDYVRRLRVKALRAKMAAVNRAMGKALPKRKKRR